MNKFINVLRNIILLIFNFNYNEKYITNEIEGHTGSTVIPIVWAYNSPDEYSFGRVPSREELDSIHTDCGDYVDWLFRDLVKAKLI